MSSAATRRLGNELRGMLDAWERHGWPLDPTVHEQVAAGVVTTPEGLLETLAGRGSLTEAQRYRLYADALGLPFVDLDWIRPDEELIALRSLREWRAQRSFPVRRIHGTLEVATSDPRGVRLPAELRQEEGVYVQRLVATPSQVDEYLLLAEASQERVNASLASVDLGLLDERMTGEQLQRAGIQRLATELVLFAKKRRASDVHVEALEGVFRVRLRVDGRLHETLELPGKVGLALLAVYKVLADLDIAERRLPQDGRLRIVHEHTLLDLRLSTVPTQHGEKAVLRLLDPRSTNLSLSKLAFSQRVLQPYRRLLEQPHGILFVTGPTGSGKTTTLYASLVELADPAINITTIEDPIEYQLGGVNQIQVHPKIGLTFARVLRATLRQDPDVLLIGEIRDEETAQVAVQAALTGHLVLTTLHTNSAPATVARLRDMGVPDKLLGEALLGAMGQRLVRRICGACRKAYAPSEEERRYLGVDAARDVRLYRGAGCSECHGTGFVGRMPVHELLLVSGRVRDGIAAGEPSSRWIEDAHAEGYRPLWHDALVKVLAGHTTLEEARRVTLVKEF